MSELPLSQLRGHFHYPDTIIFESWSVHRGSARHYSVGLEPVGARTEQATTSTSKSAVSRRFVAQTQTALAELPAADLTSLDLVAFMVDGVHFGEHTCVVALGIDIDGTKHPLSLVEGSTENATLVTELIVGLRERGLEVTRPVLAVLDGSKALRRGVLDVFDRPEIGRGQLHKIRSVQDHLPEKLRSTVTSRMRRAYHADSALAAEAELTALAAELDRTHPGAAASVREGMAETLTVLRLNLPPTLAHTSRSTNDREHDLALPDHSCNVKRWRDGQMALVRRRDGRSRQAVPPGQRPHTPANAAPPRWRRSPNLSVPPVMLTPSQPPDDHRAATEFHGTSRDMLRTTPRSITAAGPAVMATLRNLAISLHRLAGATNIAAACRHVARHLNRILPLLT